MNIPPKYEDVVAQLEAERELHKLATEALGQFADENQKLHADLSVLLEDLEMLVKAQLGISISEPGESFVRTTLRLYRMSKRRAAEFGIPEGESLEADIEAFEGYDALQQRLTVAEQRASKLEGLLDEILSSGEWYSSALEFHDHKGLEIGEKINAALKPAEDYNELDDDEDLEVFDEQ